MLLLCFCYVLLCFAMFLIWSLIFGFREVCEGPGGLSEVREAGGKNPTNFRRQKTRGGLLDITSAKNSNREGLVHQSQNQCIDFLN